jgi:DNA (cytosine-5)-methyltransferase 3A
MNYLSLFNGCSGLFMALDDLGIKVNKYYSSEKDKFANKAATLINPQTIHLGDVTKWETWDIDWSKIDLIAAGSPCQGFSFAGKQLAFDDPRSKLFFVFIDILNHCKKSNPNVKFFLENVDMKKQHMKVINDHLGLSGQCINSNLISAQNRKRWYWTNISTRQSGLFGDTETYIEPPIDRKIFLKDIVEKEVDEKYYIKNPKVGFEGMDLLGKCNTLRVGGGASQDKKHNFDIIKLDKQLNVKSNQDKASCFTAGGNSGGNHSDMDIICVAQRGRNPSNPSDRTTGAPTEQRLEPQMDGKTNCITSVQKDNYLTDGYRLRRLTPKETMQLQTIPEKFQKILLESGISSTQLYKMMGNGWSIEIIKEYLKHFAKN